MSYHTFYENETNIILSSTFDNYFRSSISRKEIKHCIEFKLLETETKAVEVGFSCSYNSRTFVSYYQYKQGILIMKNGKSTFLDCSIEQNIGETIEICYNSLTTELKIIKNSKICTEKVSLPNPITWFAYVDHGDDTKSKISLNLGKQKFINKIPKGYETWISSFNLKNTCKIRSKILIIYLINILSLYFSIFFLL